MSAPQTPPPVPPQTPPPGLPPSVLHRSDDGIHRDSGVQPAAESARQKQGNEATGSLDSPKTPSDQGRGGPPLGCPPRPRLQTRPPQEQTRPPQEAPAPAAGDASPGADLGDDVPPVPLPEEGYDEAAAFYRRWCAEHEQDAPGDSAETAEAKRAARERGREKARTISVMQSLHHPETGEVLLTQQQVDEALDELPVAEFAYVVHVCDRDEAGALKRPHAHMVMLMSEQVRLRQVADALQVPLARVRRSRERGRGAAQRGFWLMAEYLTHETPAADGVPGQTFPDRRYQPAKYQYARGRVISSFGDGYSAALDEGIANLPAGGGGRRGRRRRREDLRDELRLAALNGEPLEAIRKREPLGYADDLPRLRELAADYRERQAAEVAAQVGRDFHKTTIVVTGRSGAGKDVVAEATLKVLQELAGLTGREWAISQPAGSRSLEDVEGAELIHIPDARHDWTPTYDEALRAMDPHHVTRVAGRFRNRAPLAPRAILLTTSVPILAHAVSVRRHANVEWIAENAADSIFDVEELLRRVTLVVDVESWAPHGADLAEISEKLGAVAYRLVRRDGLPTVQSVTDRTGRRVARISTQYRLEPVACVIGLAHVVQYLAYEVLRMHHPDVIADLRDHAPELIAARDEFRDLVIEHSEDEAGALAALTREPEPPMSGAEATALIRELKCTCGRSGSSRGQIPGGIEAHLRHHGHPGWHTLDCPAMDPELADRIREVDRQSA